LYIHPYYTIYTHYNKMFVVAPMKIVLYELAFMLMAIDIK